MAKNNFYTTETDKKDAEVMAFLRGRIKHVIYVVKENRTFDQMLGDLTNGAKADPSLTQFGRSMVPNNYKLATEFVTLDNFMHPGDGSMDGWSWTMQGRVTKTESITQQINYAAVNRGLSYESEGSNRNVPVNFATVAERDAAVGVAGHHQLQQHVGEPEPARRHRQPADRNRQPCVHRRAVRDRGRLYLQRGAEGRRHRAQLRVPRGQHRQHRHERRAGPDPFAADIVQVAPLDPALAPLTDVYFRGYDQNYPDLWRYNEWKREFDQFVANGNLPSLSLVRISHDHMGNFGTALAGVNTPETQQADCDLALGLLVEAVANSRYAADTLIIVTEDDVQDGPDHVDSHRGTAFVVGPYVKKGAVVSTHYSQISALRTIEDILGTEHINLNTAFQRPMADVFDIGSSGRWTYTAEASTVLATTMLALAEIGNGNGVRFAAGPMVKPKHSAEYWAKVTAAFDFSEADQVPTAQFNRVLWAGLMGDKPYPVLRSGASGNKAGK